MRGKRRSFTEDFKREAVEWCEEVVGRWRGVAEMGLHEMCFADG